MSDADALTEILKRLESADEKRNDHQTFVVQAIGELKVDMSAVKADVSDLKARAALADTRITKVESTDRVGRALGVIATALALFAGADSETVRAWLGGVTGR